MAVPGNNQPPQELATLRQITSAPSLAKGAANAAKDALIAQYEAHPYEETADGSFVGPQRRQPLTPVSDEQSGLGAHVERLGAAVGGDMLTYDVTSARRKGGLAAAALAVVTLAGAAHALNDDPAPNVLPRPTAIVQTAPKAVVKGLPNKVTIKASQLQATMRKPHGMVAVEAQSGDGADDLGMQADPDYYQDGQGNDYPKSQAVARAAVRAIVTNETTQNGGNSVIKEGETYYLPKDPAAQTTRTEAAPPEVAPAH